MFLLIALVIIPVAVSLISAKVTRVFYYETTDTGWQIRWGLANQIANVFILLWLIGGLLIAIYLFAAVGVYKLVVITAGLLMLACALWYLRNKQMKAIYLFYDKQTGNLKHYDWQVNSKDIARFEYQCIYETDTGNSANLHVQLKNGGKLKFRTSSPTLTIGQDGIYEEVADKLTEFTGIKCTKKNS